MDSLTIKTVLTLPGNCLGYLRKIGMTGSGYPFKQRFMESIDFLRTVENIHGLDGRIAQDALSKETSGIEKNLLACTVYEDAPVLFFNISGSEFIEFYVGAAITGIRECWNRAIRYVGFSGYLFKAGQSEDAVGAGHARD